MSGKRLLAGATFVGILAGALPAAAACNLLQLGELPVTMEGTRPMVDATLNGQPVHLIADSGAFFSTLGDRKAEELKLAPSNHPDLLMRGVNGEIIARVETARQFTVLHHTFKDLIFVVAPNYYSTRADGLLGQNFLNVWETEYDLADGAIRLFKAEGCGDAILAYWANSQPYSVIHVDPIQERQTAILGKVSVNGVQLTALFDTGASRSVLSLRGAAKAGIKRDGPDLKPAGVSGGIGRRLEQTWIAPVRSFKIGDEEIKNTRLRVGEIELDNADMLIGADFFLSHRILVANGQQRLYLTYNGGPVFNLDVASDQVASGAEPVAASAAGTTPLDTAAAATEPKDADGLVRRAEAAAARREYAQAIIDYTRANAFSPKDPQILYARGRIYEADHQFKPAIADFDAALLLKPDDKDVLMSRAALHLRAKQMDLAKADFDAAAKLDRKLMVTISALYTEQADYPEAIAELDGWLSDLPKGSNGAVGFNNRCWARASWNRELDKALADCDQALTLAPRNLSFLDSRALTYLRLSRFDEAIRDYDAILRQQPKEAWPLYCRGIAKLRAGKTANAQQDMAAAMAILPEVAERAKLLGLELDNAPAGP